MIVLVLIVCVVVLIGCVPGQPFFVELDDRLGATLVGVTGRDLQTEIGKKFIGFLLFIELS
jgi:hypothetical protein